MPRDAGASAGPGGSAARAAAADSGARMGCVVRGSCSASAAAPSCGGATATSIAQRSAKCSDIAAAVQRVALRWLPRAKTTRLSAPCERPRQGRQLLRCWRCGRGKGCRAKTLPKMKLKLAGENKKRYVRRKCQLCRAAKVQAAATILMTARTRFDTNFSQRAERTKSVHEKRKCCEKSPRQLCPTHALRTLPLAARDERVRRRGGASSACPAA